jgi:Uncharacterised nucleotidyltransferase
MSLRASENASLITAEFHLLVALTRDPEHSAVASTLRSVGAIDWRQFVALAEFHRVEGLVAAALSAHRPASVPPEVRDYFADRLRTCSLHGLSTAKATIELTSTLKRHGIPAVLLKGLAVADRYYGSPHARQSIDIDLLVPEHLVEDAQRAVESLGYVQSNPSFEIPPGCQDALRAITNDVSYAHKADGTKLELHWRLARNRRLPSWHFDTVRRHATTMPFANSALAVLEPAALMTYLICHGAKHSWFRLKWLADIDRMSAKLTPGQLRSAIELSARHGTLHLLATSLRLHQVLYGAENPIAADLAHYVDERLLRRFLCSVLASPRPHEDVRLANLWCTFRDLRHDIGLRRELAYKASALFGFLTDARDIETLRLSRRWLWVYAVAGPVLAAGRILARERRGWARSKWQPVPFVRPRVSRAQK